MNAQFEGWFGKPPKTETGCIDWLDALSEKWERRASWYDEEPNGDGKAALIRQQIRELRACAESASNATEMSRAVKGQSK